MPLHKINNIITNQISNIFIQNIENLSSKYFFRERFQVVLSIQNFVEKNINLKLKSGYPKARKKACY